MQEEKEDDDSAETIFGGDSDVDFIGNLVKPVYK